MKKRIVIGVMGPGSNATVREIENAKELGINIARNGWTTLTGGSNTGVMNAALEGAKSFDSTSSTVGILSHRGDLELTSKYVDIAIPTGMGEGRNYLNISSVDIVVICCNDLFSSLGTMSEFIFALKQKKQIIILGTLDFMDDAKELTDFIRVMTNRYCGAGMAQYFFTHDVELAVEKIHKYIYEED